MSIYLESECEYRIGNFCFSGSYVDCKQEWDKALYIIELNWMRWDWILTNKLDPFLSKFTWHAKEIITVYIDVNFILVFGK